MPQVKDVMTQNCQWISPDTSVEEAAQKMREEDFGFLPIGDGDKLIGMVTDRDIVVRCVAAGNSCADTPVSEIMSKNTYYCYDDQDLAEVCDNLGEIKVRRLPVVNRDKQLVGVISMGDLAQQAANANVGQTEQEITEALRQNKAA